MQAIKPDLLYELGELKELIGRRVPAAGGLHQKVATEDVACPHILKGGEVWVKGQDVIDWLASDGGNALPGKKAPATEPSKAPKDK